MIRLLIALIIVALLLSAVSRMYGLPGRKAAEPSWEDTEYVEEPEGLPYEPYNRAEQFSDEYPEALDEQRKRIDEQIDGA